MRTAGLVAVVLLAACDTAQNTDPGVATYAIDAQGVHCNAPDLETEFGTSDGSTFLGNAHICRWDCITYHGEVRRMVTLEFLQPADKYGVLGAWAYFADKSEPSQYCPATTSP
jgi:hypothetical protein